LLVEMMVRLVHKLAVLMV